MHVPSCATLGEYLWNIGLCGPYRVLAVHVVLGVCLLYIGLSGRWRVLAVHRVVRLLTRAVRELGCAALDVRHSFLG